MLASLRVWNHTASTQRSSCLENRTKSLSVVSINIRNGDSALGCHPADLVHFTSRVHCEN
jgi:hypothetical protein